MKEIDRRSVVTGFLCGGVIAAMGLTVMPKAAKSLPLGAVKAGVVNPQDFVKEARVTVHVHPRRRHRGRHWRCWWHRGRRVCGWRC
jgi:hypothetical protein